jgi:beta-lactamase superfamily II metal-dependent hydrolase
MKNRWFSTILNRRTFFGLLVAALALVPFAAQNAQSAARQTEVVVDVLDIGQGDSILVRSPEGKTALIDAGPTKSVVSLLRQKGVTSIDLLVLSHHHSDHYGGMAEVVRQFKPRVFLASNSSHTTSSYLKLLQLIRDEGIRVIAPTETVRKIGLGSVVLSILPQPPDNTQEENDNSIGVRLDYGNFAMLMTGDSEERSRAYWMKNCPTLLKDCTVLKLAHHGSRNGTNAKWLDLVRPEQTVASLAAGNSFGHPHAETVTVLQQKQIPFIRTDQVGTVTFLSDGKTWDMSTDKRARASEVGAVASSSRPRSKPKSGSRTASRDNDVRMASSAKLVDLNEATIEELMQIPGIGPTTAKKVIQGRPYRSIDDLSKLQGLGSARLAELEAKTTVR